MERFLPTDLWPFLPYRNWRSWWTTTTTAIYFKSSPSPFRIAPLCSWKSFRDTTIRWGHHWLDKRLHRGEYICQILIRKHVWLYWNLKYMIFPAGLRCRKLQISFWSYRNRPACQRKSDYPDTEWRFKEHVNYQFNMKRHFLLRVLFTCVCRCSYSFFFIIRIQSLFCFFISKKRTSQPDSQNATLVIKY